MNNNEDNLNMILNELDFTEKEALAFKECAGIVKNSLTSNEINAAKDVKNIIEGVIEDELRENNIQ